MVNDSIYEARRCFVERKDNPSRRAPSDPYPRLIRRPDRSTPIGPNHTVPYGTVPFLHGYQAIREPDRKSTRLNSSHTVISYAVFCLKKKKKQQRHPGSTSARHASMWKPNYGPSLISYRAAQRT